jgi:type VI secretion system protein ImpH
VHITDYARARIRHHADPTFHRFLDIFHHRMLSFFYRAWARVRPTVNLDRGVRDRFGEYVAAFFGLGMEALSQRDAFPDLAKRHYAGLLSCQTKHAEGLLSMLKGYFDLPVELEQFIGQWLPLPEECLCQIGDSPAISTLGETITVGSHIWDCQQKFRVQFGPLDLEDYFHLLPVSMRLLESPASPLAEDHSPPWPSSPRRSASSASTPSSRP